VLAAQRKASLAWLNSVAPSELDDCSHAKARREALNSTGNVIKLNKNTMANMAIPTQNKAGKMLMMNNPMMMTIIDSFDEMLTAGTKA
jgi:hypothetical protein